MLKKYYGESLAEAFAERKRLHSKSKNKFFASLRLGSVSEQDNPNPGIHYHENYFSPYVTFKDFRANVQACVLKPIIDVLTCCGYLRGALNNVCILVVKLLTFDISEAGKFLYQAAECAFGAFYYAFSAVTDTLDSLLRLATHGVSTLLFAQAFRDRDEWAATSPSSP